MKVDIVTDELGAIGGGSAETANLVKWLSASGIEVTVFGFKSRESTARPYYKVIARSTGSSILNSLILLLKAPFIGIHKDSVIQTHRVVHALPFLWRRNPIVAEEIGRVTEEMRMRHSWPVVAIYNLVEGICIRHVDRVVAVDAGTRDYLERKHRLKHGMIEVIPVGVDLSEFKPGSEAGSLSRYGVLPGKKVVLFVGRIDPVKNLAMLLEAFKRVIAGIPECDLVIVGTGKEEGRLKKMAEGMGISNKVFFTGLVQHKYIPGIMASANVFAFTSLNEGSPNVVREAIACGLPVVSTRVGDVATYLENGVNGYIVDDFDPANFAAHLVRALQNEEQLRQGCLKTRERLSAESVVKRYESLYREVLSKTRR